MVDCMTFPETLDEFLEQYQFKDSEEIYTNGSMLIPVFRVKQWDKHTDRMRERVSVGNVMEYRPVKYDPDEFFHHKRQKHTGFIPPLNRCASSIFVEDTNVPSKRQTNADRIRAMSDEELAEWLDRLITHCNDGPCFTCFMQKACLTNMLDWLQQEVDNG